MGIPKNQAYQPEGPIDPSFGLFVDARRAIQADVPGVEFFRS